MTQQEFVKKESEEISNKAFPPESEWSETKLLIYNEFKNGAFNGLSKGLEIAKEFTEWTQRMKYKQSRTKIDNGEWYRQAAGYGGGEPHFYTTDELLTIFITEKYGQ